MRTFDLDNFLSWWVIAIRQEALNQSSMFDLRQITRASRIRWDLTTTAVIGFCQLIVLKQDRGTSLAQEDVYGSNYWWWMQQINIEAMTTRFPRVNRRLFRISYNLSVFQKRKKRDLCETFGCIHGLLPLLGRGIWCRWGILTKNLE